MVVPPASARPRDVDHGRPHPRTHAALAPRAKHTREGMRFAKVPTRMPFGKMKMRWPTSPVQYEKKRAPPQKQRQKQAGRGLFVTAKEGRDRTEDEEEPREDAKEAHSDQDGEDIESMPKVRAKPAAPAGEEDTGSDNSLRVSVEALAIDLRAQRVPVQSVGLASTSPSASPSSPVQPFSAEAIPFDERALIRLTLQEELEEFCEDTKDHGVRIFPEYFSRYERQLVQEIADRLGLGCEGRDTISVFKVEAEENALSSSDHLRHPALTRVQSMPVASSIQRDDDVFVDVPSLTECGRDGVLARLELHRLDSGGGIHRRMHMLWDVAQLSPQDRIADRITEGQGGVYAVQSRTSGTKLAMFKPADEERFVREGINPGEGAVREEAAYVLDSRSRGFSGVPATAAARLQLAHSDRAQNGAVQRFMQGTIGSMEGYGMPFSLEAAKAFVPVEQVHRIALLDIRTFNTDRHAGNILLLGDHAPFTMVPIDHGCILPSWYHLSEARFDWLAYPQSHAPLSARSRAFIAALNADEDAAALRQLGIREECVTTARICVLFLHLAAQQHRSVHWMGSFLQRSGCFETPSRLELAIAAACQATGIAFSFVPNEMGEHKSLLPLNALSRRPPHRFFLHLEQLLTQAIATSPTSAK